MATATATDIWGVEVVAIITVGAEAAGITITIDGRAPHRQRFPALTEA